MMRRIQRVLPLILLIQAFGYGQSLADAARQNRQQKESNTNTAKPDKVFTSDDLAASPAETYVPPAGQTPEMWTRQIVTQKIWVRYFQGEFDKVSDERAKVHNVGFQSNHPLSDGAGTEVDQRFERVQGGLMREKAKLEAMQQAAQKAGMPPSVYDPPIPANHTRRSSNAGMIRYMRTGH